MTETTRQNNQASDESQFDDAVIRVLLVDDDKLVSELVEVLLSNDQDIKLFVCSDANRAVTVARRIRPSIILQDLVLPDIDGITLVESYRKEPTLAGVPIVVLSATEAAETKSRAFGAGANDYLIKMPDYDELAARIRYHSNAYKEHRSLQDTIKKLEEVYTQLLQSEKMASIGQLAAGVAHEINNPVGFISSNMGALQTYHDDLFKLIIAYQAVEAELPETAQSLQNILALKKDIDLEYLQKDFQQVLHECKDGLDRVKKIVTDLKDFSHVDSTEWQWAGLSEEMDRTLNIANNEIKYKAEVIREYQTDLPQVECIPSQLNQVFLNLLVNSAQAIDGMGTIHVQTKAAPLDIKYHQSENDKKNDRKLDEWICIKIQDNGTGIEEDLVKRIFEPFFTTKAVGKGTGLGLSLSYGIINSHGGYIDVKSRSKEGSTFTIWLPVRQSSQDETAI